MEPVELVAGSRLKSYEGKSFDDTPSPLGRWLQPFVLSVEANRLLLKFTVREEWLNPMGNLHGGISAAIIDDATGTAVFGLGEDSFYTTVSNHIEYLSTTGLGNDVVAEVVFLRKGRRFLHAECRLWNTDMTAIIAAGSSVWYKTARKKK